MPRIHTSWASQPLPPRYLRAILQLPGELRPIALRSFHSIGCRAQLDQISTTSSQHAIQLHRVSTPSSFLEGHGGEKEKQLGEGIGRKIVEGDHTQRPGGRRSVGLEASDEYGAMGNANALEVNEDKDEKTGHEVLQQNGLFKGLKPNHVSRVFSTSDFRIGIDTSPSACQSLSSRRRHKMISHRTFKKSSTILKPANPPVKTTFWPHTESIGEC